MKPRFGIVGGSGLSRAGLLEGAEARKVPTPYGDPSGRLEVGTWVGAGVAFLSRHGPRHAIPPHQVNHKANLWALKEQGVEGVVATSSVGSLDRDLGPGTLVVPDDYLCPWERVTYFDAEVVHVTPGLDPDLRRGLVEAGRREGLEVRDGGVYVQTRGPRLETRAEIRFLAGLGDLVGMTMASEATLAREIGLPYASLCSVDNYAHGLVEGPLTYEEIQRVQAQNADTVRRVLRAFLEGAG